ADRVSGLRSELRGERRPHIDLSDNTEALVRECLAGLVHGFRKVQIHRDGMGVGHDVSSRSAVGQRIGEPAQMPPPGYDTSLGLAPCTEGPRGWAEACRAATVTLAHLPIRCRVASAPPG